MNIPKKFPVLGIAEDGDIVLFTGVSKKDNFLKGVLIDTNFSRSYAVGEYRKDWIPECFKLYKKPVVVDLYKSK
jgi:hypothetical protein